MSWPSHGSNPQYIYQFIQEAMPDKLIDFSVNVNPFGAPEMIQQKWGTWFQAIEDYPDPFGERLKTLISKEEGISKQSILLGNGGAEIIHLLANLFRKKRVLIIQPTFSEYERMCRAYDCDISYLILQECEWDLTLDRLVQHLEQADVVFFCHPNNPTGVIYPEGFLSQMIKACQTYDCYFIVDEAFYDFVSKPVTLAPYVKNFDQLVIIRSMTKMYAIAGLRLGYMIAHHELIEKAQRFQTHWSVNALALLAGEESVLAKSYTDQTREYFSNERERIIPFLRKIGYFVSDSQVNFYVLRDPQLADQIPFFKFMLKRGFVPRHTANYPGLNGRWLRFAIRKEAENDQLLAALADWKNMSH